MPKALGKGLGPPEKPPKGSCWWPWGSVAGGGKAEKPGPLLDGPKGSSKLAGPGEKLAEGGARFCSWGGCLLGCGVGEMPSPEKESRPPSNPAGKFEFLYQLLRLHSCNSWLCTNRSSRWIMSEDGTSAPSSWINIIISKATTC